MLPAVAQSKKGGGGGWAAWRGWGLSLGVVFVARWSRSGAMDGWCVWRGEGCSGAVRRAVSGAAC